MISEALEQNPQLALLLLLARQQLRPDRIAQAERLAGRVSDWNDFFEKSRKHFILPMVCHHLSKMDNPPELGRILKEQKMTSRQLIASALRNALAQQRFSEQVMESMSIEHAFIKGQALAGLYYKEPGFRQARDIDVLVARRNLVPVAIHAQTKGYRLVPSPGKLSERDIQAYVHFRPVLSLLSPEGVLIEVHDQLDKTGLIFNTETLLAAVQKGRVHNRELFVLPIEHHFVFVCLHSTRHLWSHLHWLVDLDALVNDQSFDEQKVLDIAQQCRLTATVQASLAMYRAVYLEQQSVLRDSVWAKNLLDLVIRHLVEDPSLEFELRLLRPYPDFAFEWQAWPTYRWRTRLTKRLEFLKPSYKDYQALPMPQRLHWLYFFIRPIAGLLRRLRRNSEGGKR